MRPLTADRPKGLVEVGDAPLLTHVFRALVPLDPAELVVVVGYRGEQIRDRYGDTFEGTPIAYVRQDERRGLGHAVLQAAPLVDGDFLVMNGDNVCRANLADLLTRHRETDADATLLVERVSKERAGRGGVLDTEGGEVVGLVEKPDDPPSRLIPRGVFAFSPAVFRACRSVTPGHTGEIELTAAVDRLVGTGRRVETVDLSGWCHNVNEPADRERVTERL
jgi:glucose-1-phosphate thymidylyltransferase